MPGPVRALDHALVDQHPQELLGEQRVALRGGDDVVEHVGLERSAAQHALDHRPARLRPERLEVDPCRAGADAPVRVLVDELGTRRADHENGRVVDRLDELLDHLEERRLRPVDVLHHECDGSFRCHVLEEAPHPPGKLLHRERLGPEADHRAEPLRHVRAGRICQRRELREGVVGIIVVDDAGGVLQRLCERPERDAVAIGQAPALESERAVGDPAEELGHEARLSDPRVRDDGHEAGGRSGHGLVEGGLECVQLALPADQRSAVTHFDVAGFLDADELVCRDGLGLPLEHQRLYLDDLDAVADEPVRELSQQHLLLTGRLLEPSRHVDRVARHQSLVGRRVAGDDLTRVDASPVGELDAVVAVELDVELLERRLHSRGGPYRAECVVLVEPGEAEDGHHRVADELLDHATVALELFSHRVEVARHHLAQRLGVERLSEACRPLQVREDDRHDLPRLLRCGRVGQLGAAGEAEACDVGVLGAAAPARLHAASVRTRRVIALRQ